MTTYRTAWNLIFMSVLPQEVGGARARLLWTTSKMPKITISGIAVLGFLELRDRVWEGTGLFSHAFGANQAQRAGSSNLATPAGLVVARFSLALAQDPRPPSRPK